MIALQTRIRKLRQFTGYSQDILADELSMTQSAYSKLETGKTLLTVQRVEQLATFYEISINDLLQKDLAELRLLLVSNPKFNSI